MVFHGKTFNSSHIWLSFQRLSRDLNRSKQPRDQEVSPFLTPRVFFLWHPPDIGCIQINVNVVVPLNHIGMAVSTTAHDYNGKWLGSGMRKDVCQDIVGAEMEAVFLGLCLAS